MNAALPAAILTPASALASPPTMTSVPPLGRTPKPMFAVLNGSSSVPLFPTPSGKRRSTQTMSRPEKPDEPPEPKAVPPRNGDVGENISGDLHVANERELRAVERELGHALL